MVTTRRGVRRGLTIYDSNPVKNVKTKTNHAMALEIDEEVRDLMPSHLVGETDVLHNHVSYEDNAVFTPSSSDAELRKEERARRSKTETVPRSRSPEATNEEGSQDREPEDEVQAEEGIEKVRRGNSKSKRQEGKGKSIAIRKDILLHQWHEAPITVAELLLNVEDVRIRAYIRSSTLIPVNKSVDTGTLENIWRLWKCLFSNPLALVELDGSDGDCVDRQSLTSDGSHRVGGSGTGGWHAGGRPAVFELLGTSSMVDQLLMFGSLQSVLQFAHFVDSNLDAFENLLSRMRGVNLGNATADLPAITGRLSLHAKSQIEVIVTLNRMLLCRAHWLAYVGSSDVDQIISINEENALSLTSTSDIIQATCL